MNQNKLVATGETSAAKAFARFIPLTIFFCVAGVFFIIIGLIWSESAAIRIVGYRNSEMAYAMGKIGFILFGLLFMGGGFLFPFANVSETKKLFINVYEDRVCGAYFERYKGYIPYEFTFSQIESVSYDKTKIFLQVSGRTLCSKAFNSQEIVDAIQKRINS